jgi:hypothetical protein
VVDEVACSEHDISRQPRLASGCMQPENSAWEHHEARKDSIIASLTHNVFSTSSNGSITSTIFFLTPSLGSSYG